MEIHNTKKFIKAKKNLGQNFLKSEKALNQMILSGEIQKEDTIIEIGPGKGALTQKLLENSSCVIAIEKDKRMVEFLEEKFKKEIEDKKLILIEEDIINIEPNILLEKLKSSDKNKKKDFEPIDSNMFKKNILYNYKIIANIPYNITGMILKKFLTEKTPPQMMVLMVQKEVAERITSKNNKENLLSLSVKIYGEPKTIMKVPKRYFSPEPKVDSAILQIKNISKNKLIEHGVGEEILWQILKCGFAHKRKTLLKNLQNYAKNKKINWQKIFDDLKILKNKRAEDLKLEDWFNITKIVENS